MALKIKSVLPLPENPIKLIILIFNHVSKYKTT